MKLQKYCIFPLIITALVSGCASNNSNSNQETSTPTSTPTPSLEISTPPTPTPSSIPIPTPTVTKSVSSNKTPDKKAVAYNPSVVGKTTDVTLYTIDNQCQDFISQTTAVSSEEPISGAVSKVLEKGSNGDFSLSSYRVNVKNGLATVDLRVAPNSKRSISSLSSCEQNAIFGSLRKTLTSNPQWKIKDVRFTEKGEEIVL
jgi:hypothetical protein